jgi:RNA polymerase sigma factor (sigma-70 family)
MSSDFPAVIEENEAALRLDAARALAGLEEMDRRIVLLRYYSQANSGEIAAMLDMPERTVRYRLARARQALAPRLTAWSGQGNER